MVKRIALKLLLLFLLTGVPYLCIKSYYVLQYDINYYKATGKANHLILGLSRAKRGLSPEVFKQELDLEGKMTNFAFNNLQSPFGPKYYQAIKRKVVKSEKNGVFIISVTPGSIMELVNDDYSLSLREDGFFYYNLWFQNSNPNLEYILKSPIREGSLFQFLRSKYKVILGLEASNWPEFMHEDGWGELDVSKRPSRLKPLIIQRTFKPSFRRERFLRKTILFLQQHGTVILVRLPVGKDYQEYEKVMYPEFTEKIHRIAQDYQLTYLDYFGELSDLLFHDGHHLFGDGARKVSQAIAETL